MAFASRVARLWRNLFRKASVDREFEAEIEASLQIMIDARLKQGLDPKAARREALLEFGGIESLKEQVREIRMGHFLETLWQDVRYGSRSLLRSPVFTVTAALSLALGIGANTAIFSVVNHLLLKPLPYPEPERIVDLWHTPPQESFPGLDRFSVSPGNYLDWKQQSQSYEQMAVYRYAGFNLSAGDRPASLMGARVSSDFFSALRTNAALGRVFSGEEEQAGRNRVVALSHGLWRRAFGADPNLIGQTITLDSQKYTVVGVMPAEFDFPRQAELWTPLVWDEKERKTRSIHDYMVVARLNPGVSMEKAKTELNVISSRLEQEYPEANKGWGAVVIPLQEDLIGDIRPALLVLFCAVGFVLLIACANVANLMLARGANRRKEIAIRLALGAQRIRVIRQLITESILLAIGGGAIGLLLASLGGPWLAQLGADYISDPGRISLDPWALGFTLLISISSGIVAGVAPAFQYSSADANDALKEGTGRTGSGAVKQRTRQALVIVEVALSMILLVGAGLMIRSFWKLQQVNPGFNIDDTVSMNIGLPNAKYSDPQQQAAYFDRVLEQIRALPGVISAGSTTTIPLSGLGSAQPFTIEGRPAAEIAKQPLAQTRYISPEYFQTMGIPLRQGRDFSDRDREKSLPVVIISESMARQFWPGENPIGRRMTASFSAEQGLREIIGVVGDVKTQGLDTDVGSTMYLPYRQIQRRFMSLVARTASDPQQMIPAITKAIYSIDPEQAITNIRTMKQIAAASTSGRRYNMILLMVFAGLALALASVGVYGVMNYSVMLRRRELGVRMALGASSADVLRMVLGQGLALTLIGIAAGLLGAFALTRLMSKLLYGISSTDLPTFGSVALALLLIGLLASFLPAYRATKVDPMIALRAD